MKLANDDVKVKTIEILALLTKIENVENENANLKKELLDKKDKLQEKTGQVERSKFKLDVFEKENQKQKNLNMEILKKQKKQEEKSKSLTQD